MKQVFSKCLSSIRQNIHKSTFEVWNFYLVPNVVKNKKGKKLKFLHFCQVFFYQFTTFFLKTQYICVLEDKNNNKDESGNNREDWRCNDWRIGKMSKLAKYLFWIFVFYVATLIFLKLIYPKHGTSWSVRLKFTFISMWHL